MISEPELAMDKDTTHALTNLAGAREAMGRIAEELHRQQRQITDLCLTLPEHGEHFDPRDELRNALHCVNRDLIDDAIKTLRRAATATAEQLRLDFDRRQQLLASPLALHTPCRTAAGSTEPEDLR